MKLSNIYTKYLLKNIYIIYINNKKNVFKIVFQYQNKKIIVGIKLKNDYINYQFNKKYKAKVIIKYNNSHNINNFKDKKLII